MSFAFSRPLLGLILSQICIHGCMAGARMAAPLHALRSGQSAWAVGLLLALFALAPVALALPSGRLADRWGYHRPIRVATGLSVAGALLAALGQSFEGAATYALMCAGALCTGAAANMVVIASQRTAGMMASDNLQRVQVFSWLGLAPALANMAGPVVAGLVIDAAGFQAAFGLLALVPFAALHWSRWVPGEAPGGGAGRPAAAQGAAARPSSWSLLRSPALLRLLLLNWMLSASWDMHSFVLPILGHERGLSASAIGLILGLFAAAVTVVRLLIPLLVHRLSQAQVLSGAMLLTAAVFTAYPFVHEAPVMAVCAMLLGLALGSVQPMIMSTLHHITPDGHHGQVIALRSMVVNLSSTGMPVLFGVAGTALGVGTLFWAMAAIVASGSLLARRISAWAQPA